MKIETDEQASEKKSRGSLELVGQLMDLVEDFLEEREKTEEPILVRNNYDRLSNAITETLQNWGLLSEEGGQL